MASQAADARAVLLATVLGCAEGTGHLASVGWVPALTGELLCRQGHCRAWLCWQGHCRAWLCRQGHCPAWLCACGMGQLRRQYRLLHDSGCSVLMASCVLQRCCRGCLLLHLSGEVS